MQLGVVSGDSPVYPYAAVLFAVAFVGILIVMFSKNAPLKRLALPVALAAFHACAFLIIVGGSKLAGRPLVLGGIGLALTANAVRVGSSVRFCVQCGATTPRIQSPPWHCAACRDRSGTP